MPDRTYFAVEGDLVPSTLTGIFLDAVERFGDRPAFRYFREPGVLADIAYRDAFQRVKEVGAALADGPQTARLSGRNQSTVRARRRFLAESHSKPRCFTTTGVRRRRASTIAPALIETLLLPCTRTGWPRAANRRSRPT